MHAYNCVCADCTSLGYLGDGDPFGKGLASAGSATTGTAPGVTDILGIFQGLTGTISQAIVAPKVAKYESESQKWIAKQYEAMAKGASAAAPAPAVASGISTTTLALGVGAVALVGIAYLALRKPAATAAVSK